MRENFSGMKCEGMTSKVQSTKIENEHDLTLDFIPVLHLDLNR